MKRSKVRIPWKEGLHLRLAADVVKRAMEFSSTIQLKANKQIANARSIMSIILLSATMGTVVEVEAVGEDEELALNAIVEVFSPEGSGMEDMILPVEDDDEPLA